MMHEHFFFLSTEAQRECDQVYLYEVHGLVSHYVCVPQVTAIQIKTEHSQHPWGPLVLLPGQHPSPDFTQS